jgi:branched-chain amino acid transport system ATP-binding protein
MTAAMQPAASDASPILAVSNLEVVYDDVILVLRGVSLEVPEGKIVALLGGNGAGKTTLLRAITGLLDIHEGEITKGRITLDDKPIHRLQPSTIVRSGIAQVLEGRRIFAEFTVEENLRVGAHTSTGGKLDGDLDRVYGLFPILKDRRKSTAGYLSGGEQQMLATGRALMADPCLLMLDEPSLGLAPLMVEEVFGIIRRLNTELGLTALLVEQNARRALEVADRGDIIESGRIMLEGPAAELAENPDVKEFYLGLGDGGARKSYRDVKHYKRRKRWL